jgi:hypothetical protein
VEVVEFRSVPSHQATKPRKQDMHLDCRVKRC